MKLREALPLLTLVAMLMPSAAANGAPFAGFAANESPDVVEVRQYALTLDKAQKTAQRNAKPSTDWLRPILT